MARGLLRRGLRWTNVLVALVSLASGLAVLGSDLFVPGYRAVHRDALWLVVGYCAVQMWIVVEFARERPTVAWLAAAKLAATFVFFATMPGAGLYWIVWTPGRYVYQLFDWGGDSKVGLFALTFLGRGAFNALNTLYWTAPWWRPLRERHPLVGRAVTSVGVAIAAVCVSAFFALVAEEGKTFSAEAQDVARLVLAQLDCESVRMNDGKKTTDLRQRGERRYYVEIEYGCALTRVTVRAEDGRIGFAAGPQGECCAQRS